MLLYSENCKEAFLAYGVFFCRDLLKLEPRIRQIAELNPWIMQAFEYMLQYPSIMAYITQKSDILFHFDLETIIRCLEVQLKNARWVKKITILIKM